jgi:hypothetical protein
MDNIKNKKILSLKEQIISNFKQENWEEIGLLTDTIDYIQQHNRLLRSLSWGDEDYAGCVLEVLIKITSLNDNALEIIEKYINKKFQNHSHYISAKPSQKKITFAPDVFEIPKSSMEEDLIAVMMPFDSQLENVYTCIKEAATTSSFRAVRADDIWENSTIIQDIFELIYKSKVVIADFSGKNPNVMYEVGIAHTLGKLVIPISQSLDDVPFDLKHHRALKYLLNGEGIENLKTDLIKKLKTV